MTLSLYDMTIPVLTRALKNTHALVQKAESWCKENGKPESEMLEARLSPDMNTFVFQIRACCMLSRSCTLTDAWGWAPSSTALDGEDSLAGLAGALQKEIQRLEALKKEDVDGREGNRCHLWTSGIEGVGFEADFADGIKFLNQFGLPNFWFHNSIAYGLCRMKGVPLGKVDFLMGGGPLDF
ncbi:hypothetical protein SLS55_003462 [Diplodia seriata]|uniref:Uncharacterized protein n=1 Tax=Diplodia seriata TaxID=420778 RepID=A0ABR3CN32_9PEZI